MKFSETILLSSDDLVSINQNYAYFHDLGVGPQFVLNFGAKSYLLILQQKNVQFCEKRRYKLFLTILYKIFENQYWGVTSLEPK